MIHFTLPLRPRSGTHNSSYLVTPLSVINQSSGKKIICITANKSDQPQEETIHYLNLVREKIGLFDSVYTDFSIDFIDYIKNIKSLLPLFSAKRSISSCECGYYSELENIRKFNLSKVRNELCLNCNTKILNKIQDVLIFRANWNLVFFQGMYPKWVASDLDHFLGRQTEEYLFTKEGEKILLSWGDDLYGIKYQFQWVLLLLHIANVEKEKDFTLHYVNSVQDKAFFITSMVKMIDPSLNIYLKALPIIWLNNKREIGNITENDLILFKKGLKSIRKEVTV